QASAFSIYGSKTDVFSLGLILIELLAWNPSTELKLIFDDYRAGKQSDHISDEITAEFVNLLTRIDPKDRPTCEEMLAHSYLA
ncbi:hypothetical protein PMAYCL1PPCAC_09357, partial [Pristionchus mayeri]